MNSRKPCRSVCPWGVSLLESLGQFSQACNAIPLTSRVNGAGGAHVLFSNCVISARLPSQLVACCRRIPLSGRRQGVASLVFVLLRRRECHPRKAVRRNGFVRQFKRQVTAATAGALIVFSCSRGIAPKLLLRVKKV